MSYIRLLIVSLILTCTINAQWSHYRPNNKPIKINKATDTEVIKSISQDLVNAVASGNLNIISKYLSKDIDTSYTAANDTSSVFTPLISLDSVAVSYNADKATLKCIVYDRATKSKKYETMVLRRTNGRWEIASSRFLIKIIKRIKERNLSNANSRGFDGNTTGQSPIKFKPGAGAVKTLSSNSKSNTKQNTVQSNSIILSNNALVRVPILYTDVMTVNKTLTQDNLSCNLFSDPYDAKIVSIPEPGDIKDDLFSVVTDNTWDRIIYGSRNGKWVKSYGDNPGDQKLLWASSIGLDKFGNIFVLAGPFPSTNLYRLKYNEAAASISFVQQVSMPQVLSAADMCLDYNHTPDDLSDDSFWIADQKGNSIQQYDWNGNILGKYTKVINSSTGAETDFSNPTRIIAYDDWGKIIALIDNNRSRVTVISQISSYKDNAIYGNYVSYQFQESVSLNSLGFFDDIYNGLWVADKLNGMFHIFDAVYGGYLASVKYTADGQQQWQSPKGMYSTVMSNSYGNYLYGLTLDKWDITNGVNTYIAGTDLINPVVNYTFDGLYSYAAISVTILTHSSVTTDLYREDGTFIGHGYPYDWPAGNQLTMGVMYTDVFNGSNALGKFRMSFNLTPYYNSHYDSYQQQPQCKDVWFTLPVYGSISGPSSGSPGNNLTWTAVLTSGSGDFSYTWYRQDAGSNDWIQVSSGSSSYSQTMNYNGFTIRCDVKDNYNGNVTSITKMVDQVWTGNITINGNFSVPNGVTLTIQPGTTINFASGATMVVSGTLKVNGNSADPINFNSADADQNVYILSGASMQVDPGATLNFSNGLSLGVTGTLTAVGTSLNPITFNFCRVGYIQLYGSGTSKSVLQYAVINNAPHGVMFTTNSNGTIQNCKLNNNKYGVYIYYSSPQVLNNQIINPSIEGIHIDGSSSNPIISGNVITGGGTPGTIWSGNVIITSNYTVNSGATLTIQPGTTVNFTSGAGLTVNGTLKVNGTVNFNFADANQNVMIMSGGSMQVSPGATLNFSSSLSLGIIGTLTAAGTSTNRITFNLSGIGYIQIYGSGSSSSVLQYATINSSNHGVMFSTGANATIQYCILNNCKYGVYIYSSSPKIQYNQIYNPSIAGIYIDAPYLQQDIYSNLIKNTTANSSATGIYSCNYSTPYIANNKVSGFNYGIYIGGGSVTRFLISGYVTPGANNLIYGNTNGLTAAYGATVFGAHSTSEGGGNNSIHGNSYHDLYAYQQGVLYAYCDYLGSSPLITGTNYYTLPLLTTDPWGGLTPSIKLQNNSKFGDVVEAVPSQNPVVADSSSSDLFTAFNLESKGDISGAITKYLSMLAKDSDADLAITELFKLMKQYSRNDVLTFFGSFLSSNKHYPLVSKLIADNNLQTGQFDKAISTYDNLSKKYPKDYLGINAKFQKLFAYVNIKNDMATAQQILTEIKAQNLTDPMWDIQIKMAENLINSSNNFMNREQVIKALKSTESENIPKEYALSNNYPNPFNPTTVIEYQLPKDGFVSLKVYDILGREIKTLVNGYRTVGNYSVNFDGSNLASGIYIYQLKVNGFSSIKKMILTK